MAAGKEIRTKIKSVENTKKITKAMEMVAAAKMRKAQDRMRTARPYSDKVAVIAGHLSLANPEYKHPFVVANDAKKPVGLVLVTTDKGLCGGLNTNMLRAVTAKLKEVQAAGNKAEVVAMVEASGGNIARVAREMRLHDSSVGNWVRLAREAKEQARATSKGARALDAQTWQGDIAAESSKLVTN